MSLALLEPFAESLGLAPKVSAWLSRFGYVDFAATALSWAVKGGDLKAVLQHAISEAEKLHGIGIDELVDAPRCGCSDRQMLTANATNLAQWPKGYKVKLFLGDLPTSGAMSAADWKDAFRDALTAWSDVSGFLWDFSDTKPGGGISVFSGREDGPSKVLAWCELPTAGIRLYQMKLDAQEQWAKSGNGILAVNVICHELGHGIGLDHIPASQGTALMNPIYNPRIAKPQPLDVAQAVLRYGKPDGKIDPPPPPGGSGFKTGKLVIDGVTVWEKVAA